jgi:REP element-mobilizing transposase RayT
MTRPLRLEVSDGLFHVTARGNEKRDIYRSDDDRQTFVWLLARTARRSRWKVLSFCLLNNHYHLLLRSSGEALSRGMHQLNGGYAQRFNARHGRVGHVFQGRFHAALVQEERYLAEALRYVALNPVRAGLCGRPEDWPWSAHRALIGEAIAPSFLHVTDAIGRFGSRAAYAAFVDAGDPSQTPAVRGVLLGDDGFAQEHLPRRPRDPEIAKHDWTPGRPSLVSVLAGPERDQLEAIAHAHRRFGYTLSAIATALDVHVSTVSRRLHRFEAAEVPDPA